MLLKKISSLVLPVIIMLTGFNTHAQDDYIKQGYVRQSRLPRSLHKVQIGLSSVGVSGYYKGWFDEELAPGRVTSIYHEGPSVSKGGLGIQVGTFSRLLKIGKTAAVALDVNMMYSYVYWKGIGSGFYTDKAWNNSATTWQLQWPVGLDLKFGSDARLEKNHRFCMSFGGGIMPSLYGTKMGDTLKKKKSREINIGSVPYVKAEMGVYWGICWKLKLMYSVGDLPLVEGASNGHKEPYWVSNFSLKNNSALTVSLVLMPFSYDWPDNGWWNNSRTSTKMYKGWQKRNPHYD